MALFRPSTRASKDQEAYLADPWWVPPGAEDPDIEVHIDTAPTAVDLPRARSFSLPDPATVHLLLLRFFLAFGWLRAFLDKVGDAAWWNGSAVTDFLSGGAATGPMAGFGAVAEAVLVHIAMPLGWLVMLLELAIGIGLATGLRFDAALGAGIGLAAIFVAAGQINPGAFYLVIQLALLGSPAGRVYAFDPWDTPSATRWAPWAAGVAVLVAIWSLLTVDHLSTHSVGDPAAVLGFLALFAVLTLGLLWYRDRTILPAS